MESRYCKLAEILLHLHVMNSLGVRTDALPGCFCKRRAGQEDWPQRGQSSGTYLDISYFSRSQSSDKYTYLVKNYR
jgi:hypothetical protein